MNHTNVVHKLSVNQLSHSLEEEHCFALLVGEYEGFDACEAALKMMHANLHFHDFLGMREFERVMNTSKDIVNKKQALEQYHIDASELMKAARKAGKKVKVEAEIKITVE